MFCRKTCIANARQLFKDFCDMSYAELRHQLSVYDGIDENRIYALWEHVKCNLQIYTTHRIPSSMSNEQGIHKGDKREY